MATPSPFGLILPARAVLTEPLAISPTQFAFTFPIAPSFSHIVVFLTPGITLPNDLVAAVYVQLPASPNTYTLLGSISNATPTAIFQIKDRLGSINIKSEQQDLMTGSEGMTRSSQNGATATVGISVESASTVQAQLQSLQNTDSTASTSLIPHSTARTQAASPTSTKVLAQRIIRNAFNFLASFAGSTGGQEVVPLKSFQDWWTKFERRIENDPGFLERDDP